MSGANVRYGVIGVGNMGTSHSGWLASGRIPGAVLTAVCDIDENRRNWAKENLPGETAVFEKYQDLLESGLVDAVIVAVTHYLHPEMAVDGMRQGLHMMVEKPAGVYADQIRVMNEEAEKHTELKFGMMFNQRADVLYKTMHGLLEKKALGEIKRVNWIITDWYRPQAYYDSRTWRATWSGEGGAVLLNQ